MNPTSCGCWNCRFLLPAMQRFILGVLHRDTSLPLHRETPGVRSELFLTDELWLEGLQLIHGKVERDAA